MANTPEYWRDKIIEKITADTTLQPVFNPASSAFDLVRRFAYAIGYVASVIDQLMDTLRLRINEELSSKQPHQLEWYRTKSLLFMYGYNLPPYSDEYDTTGMSQHDIEIARIIKYCAVEEDPMGLLTIKVAKLDGGNRAKLTIPELDSFKAYINGPNVSDSQIGKIKDAGVWVRFVSEDADMVNINLTIYYNPLVMNPDGTLILSGANPVEDAINSYLDNLDFNGEMKLAELEDRLQQAEGVTLPNINLIEVKPVTALIYTPVVIRRTPYSGYFNINNLTITYLPEP